VLILLLVIVAFGAFVYFLMRGLLLTCTTDLPRAAPGSIVAHSDGRSAAAGWLFPAGLIVPPLTLLAILLFLTLDGVAWLGAARAALRQRHGRPPSRTGVDFGLGPDWMLEASENVPYRSASPVLAAWGSPRDAARAIGGNMGRLLVAAIVTTLWLGLWSSCVCVPVPNRQHTEAVKTSLNTARSAAVIWLLDFPGRCPTVDQLKAAKVIDTSFNAKDPWGNPIELVCEGDEVRARTAGPDRKPGTADDIRVPSQ
jgi:hypothetical protein